MMPWLSGFYKSPAKYSPGISVLFLSGFLAIFSGSATAGYGPWGVLGPGLPERVSTADEASNVSFYILKQTHEPVFRRQDGENYSSRILKTWSRSLDYRFFSFCPDPALEFAPGIPFGFEDFAAHISSFTSVYNSRFKLVRDGKCVNISFASPQKDYLPFWTLHEHAPTKNIGGLAELGLGPISVKSISKERIELLRKIPVRDGYNAVVFYNYKGPGDLNLENREIKDFNLISTVDVPKWVKESFQNFDNPEMKSLVLLINHPDPKVRERVYNCVDIAALRAAFYTGKTDFYNIATVLPMGVPGAVPGLPLQRCVKGGGVSARLRFANWMPGNLEQMRKFAAEFKAKSGLTLRLDQFSMSSFARSFDARPKPFDLAIVITYVSSSPKEYFRMYFRQGDIYDFDLRPMSGTYGKLLESPGSRPVEESFRELSSEIVSHALALPLSQSRRTLYYPKEIRNLNVGRGILEYPEVSEFR
jgi:hypothetical protein